MTLGDQRARVSATGCLRAGRAPEPSRHVGDDLPDRVPEPSRHVGDDLPDDRVPEPSRHVGDHRAGGGVPEQSGGRS